MNNGNRSRTLCAGDDRSDLWSDPGGSPGTADALQSSNSWSQMEEIIQRALEKSRELRYQAASEMRADLRRA